MSPWSPEQTAALVEQNLIEMRGVPGPHGSHDRSIGGEGELDGVRYVWSGVRWFKKREDMR